MWGISLQAWSTILTGCVAFFALIALIYASIQILYLRRQTRGQFLFELEARWTSNKLEEGKKVLEPVIFKVSRDMRKHYSHIGSNEENEAKKRELYSLYLGDMRKKDRDTYRKINNLLEFFEIMGLCISMKAISFDTIANFFADVAETMDEICRVHILENVRGPGPKNQGAFEHTLKLFSDSKKWLERKRAKCERDAAHVI